MTAGDTAKTTQHGAQAGGSAYGNSPQAGSEQEREAIESGKGSGHRKGHVIPGFGLSMGITVTMLSILILIPLASILGYAFHLSPQTFWTVISQKAVLYAFRTSIVSSALAALINSVMGLILAWVLVRYDFPGRRILDGLIELPFALPTAVAGITLSKMYSDTGLIGAALAKIGIRVSYTHAGITLALVFIGIPFPVRAIQPVLEKLDPQFEEAAGILGASRMMTMRKVIVPELMPAVLTGFGLAFARGVGEYGSVIYISGNNVRQHTQVVSYVIMQKLNYTDYDSAAAIALVLLILSFLILLFLNIIQIRQAKRTGGGTSTVAFEGDMTSSFRKERESRGARRFLIAVSALFLILMLVLPLISVIRNSLAEGFSFYLASLRTETVLSALKVTLIATVIAVAVNTFFGIMASWLLTRFQFRGKQLLTTLIDIPFSISPVIAGLAFIMTFGRLGWAWPLIEKFNAHFGTDVRIVFAIPGVVLATIFVTFPFVSRELIPVLNAQGSDEEEAAALMGAKGFTIFRKITFPQMKWALLYGIILCAARALGEFGAVNALSKTRGETFTLPLEIDALYLSGSADSITAAFAVSSILVILAVIVLIIRNILEHRSGK